MISNVDAQPHSDPTAIKHILARQVKSSSSLPMVAAILDVHSFSFALELCCSVMQLTSPVQWQKTLETLLGKGLERSYEIGPNKVIAGIMKRISKEHEVTNISA